MAIEDTEKKENTKKRLSLGTSKDVRNSLCKLARQYHNGQIPDSKIRNLTYVLNSILGADRHINECEKIETLENLMRGEGETVVTGKQIDNPYAADLKRKLTNEEKINAELSAELLNLKRRLAESRAGNENDIESDM
jgi:hypothetical protein